MPAIVEAISERTVTITGPRVKRWTVDEFYKLTEMGYLLPSFSMLLDGDIFELPLPTPPHVMSVTLTEGAMREAFRTGDVIRVQQPLPIGPWTDSIPDIAVVRGNPRDFDSHPTCALIVIEVADTALAIELGEKANAYAAANLADYWVLDLNAQLLLVFRDPIADAAIATGFRYATKLTLEPTDSISPLAAPQAVIRVADLLP